MKALHHNSGLTMFQIGDHWAVGFRPERKTFCLGSLTEGLQDLSPENEVRQFEFSEDGKPFEVLQFNEDDPLKENQVRAKMGCFWIVSKDSKYATV